MLNLLLVESDIDNHKLEQQLNGEGMNVLKVRFDSSLCALVKEVRPDAVIFNVDTLSEKLLAELHALNQQCPLPVVMFAQDGDKETITKAIKADVSDYVVDGFGGRSLKIRLYVAVARFKHLQSLKTALEEARVQLEDRKQIDRAKAILIKTQNFSENEAYHTLRKLAMDRNITLGEMARNVIAMAELLK